MDPKKLELVYFQITDIWKRLCEEHDDLFTHTCEEYSFLLNSDIESVEKNLEVKDHTISQIAKLDTLRQGIIESLEKDLKKPIKNVSKLLEIMFDFELEREQKHLRRFNALLIDIIERIQVQNLKNKKFLNKALLSLGEIKKEAMGVKGFASYGPNGAMKPITDTKV